MAVRMSTAPCVEVISTRGCCTGAWQAAENMASVGVRKMNASTFCSSNVSHSVSKSFCEQNASCTSMTDMNSSWARAIVSIEEMAEIGPKKRRPPAIRPIVRERCEASARAELLGRYPRRSMAACTLARVTSDTSGEWLITRETV